MKRLFLFIMLAFIIFLSACANATKPPKEGIPAPSITEEPGSSAPETPVPKPAMTETPEPSIAASPVTNPPVTAPPAMESPAEEKATPVPEEERLNREEEFNNAQETFEEALARKQVTEKIWAAFEEVRDDQKYQKEDRFQELTLESRGTLHIALITRKPVTKTEKNTYQGEGRVYLVFYDESRDEKPSFLCKSFRCLFEADVFGDGEGMYLSLITRHDYEEVEFYQMSAFSLISEGCFEAVFAEDALAYWRDRKAEFEESGKVRISRRLIRKAFFYPRLLNDPDSAAFSAGYGYTWEQETDIDLPQLSFDKPAFARVLDEGTVFADAVRERQDYDSGNAEYADHRFIVVAGALIMPDGSALVVCKELTGKWENIYILLYEKDGNLLDSLWREEGRAKIFQDKEQGCFEIYAWQGSQGWEGVDFSGKVWAEDGKIVFEPDEEQGNSYVEDFSGWLEHIE